MLGDNIRAERNRINMSQSKLGECIGVHRVTVSAYESNETDPPSKVLKKIADVLGVSIDEIMKER